MVSGSLDLLWYRFACCCSVTLLNAANSRSLFHLSLLAVGEARKSALAHSICVLFSSVVASSYFDLLVCMRDDMRVVLIAAAAAAKHTGNISPGNCWGLLGDEDAAAVRRKLGFTWL